MPSGGKHAQEQPSAGFRLPCARQALRGRAGSDAQGHCPRERPEGNPGSVRWWHRPLLYRRQAIPQARELRVGTVYATALEWLTSHGIDAQIDVHTANSAGIVSLKRPIARGHPAFLHAQPYRTPPSGDVLRLLIGNPRRNLHRAPGPYATGPWPQRVSHVPFSPRPCGESARATTSASLLLSLSNVPRRLT